MKKTKYTENRENLEQRLDGSPQKALEVNIYDAMAEISSKYHSTAQGPIKKRMRWIKGAFTGKPQQKDPAYIVVLNYNDSRPEHVSHIFNGVKPYEDPFYNVDMGNGEARTALEQLAFQDNAVLVGDNGRILRTKVMLKDIDPEQVLYMLGRPNNGAPYQAMGFSHPVHSRHTTAWAASYQMPDTTVYTLSEESGHIRRYVAGDITFSTCPEEIRKTSL